MRPLPKFHLLWLRHNILHVDFTSGLFSSAYHKFALLVVQYKIVQVQVKGVTPQIFQVLATHGGWSLRCRVDNHFVVTLDTASCTTSVSE